MFILLVALIAWADDAEEEVNGRKVVYNSRTDFTVVMHCFEPIDEVR